MHELLNQAGQLRQKTEEKRIGRSLRLLANKTRLPEPIFDGVLAVIPGTSMEVVPIYKDDKGELHVFLTKRSENDRFWPGEYHCPGSMVLNSDVVLGGTDHVWKRLKAKEFERQDLGSPVFASPALLETKRGQEVALIYYVDIPEDLKNGRYFLVNNLPENLIDHHKLIIGTAVDFYKKANV